MTEFPIAAGGAEWVIANESEQMLIQQAKRDPKAFVLIYDHHYTPIAGYVYRRTGDVHATEDIVSDVFLAAMRTLGRFRYRGVPIRAWLYRLASNAVNQWVKRQRRRHMSLVDESVMSHHADETSRRDRDEAARVRKALLQLSPKYQTVIALRYFEDLSLAEVSQATGWRLGTVKSLVSRGRQSLREKLSREG